jgi:cytochrome oxidase assembly protein ShyY1
MNSRLELLSSLTKKNRPLNRLMIVAISIRTIAALSMVILRGERDASQYSYSNSYFCGDAMKYFRPGVAPTLVVLVLLPLLVSLGFWQLGRGEQKRLLLESYAERRAAEPVPLVQLQSAQDAAFRRVRLHGQFDAEHSFLLDNRTRDGKVGVELLQPFLDQASGLWLLLNRGWLPWPDRRTPPVFTTPAQALNLNAWVYVAPGATFQLHADPAGANWPRLVTAVDPASLWTELGRSGFAYELREESGPAS